jgi:FkbM family methyltransferase
METTGMTVTERAGEHTLSFRTPRGRLATMTIREGTNDWNTLNACMTEDEYGLRDWQGTGWAIDVGGYLGGVGIGLALDNPDLRVLIVEPVPDNARLIEQNIEQNGLGERVSLLVGAIGDGTPVDVWHSYQGTVAAEHHRFVGNSTLAYDNGGALPHETAHFEQSYTLGDLIAVLGAERIALLKIDCEGGEWAFLDSSAVALCDVITGEAHSVRGHRGDDVIGLLATTHDVTISGDGAATCEFRAVAR